MKKYSNSISGNIEDDDGVKELKISSSEKTLDQWRALQSITLSGNAFIALLGCCFCGIAVAPMWPGAFSLAAKHIPNASTAMFAAFALLGDLGCTTGPTLVGLISQSSSNNISRGLLFSSVFPAIMLICLVFIRKFASADKNKLNNN